MTIKHNKWDQHLPSQAWLFTTLSCFLIFIAVPFVTRGTFFDGITYSNIARNFALNKTSFWQPQFYLTNQSIFYEHPPMHSYLQSFFYKVLGESFFVERLFNFTLFLIQSILLFKIWFHFYKIPLSTYILPLFIWITTPTVLWAIPINLLENSLLLFTTLAIYFYMIFEKKSNYLFLVISCIFTILGSLTKGPVALFTFALPMIYSLSFYRHKKNKFSRSLLLTILYLLIFITFYVLLFQLNQDAYLFIKKYLNNQVLASLNGSREAPTPFYITLFKIFLKVLPPFIVCFMLSTDKKKILKSVTSNNEFIFFFLIALSASLPLALSPKQRGFYVVPSLFFYSLSFSFLFYDSIIPRVKKFFQSQHLESTFQRLSILLLCGSFIYFISMIGKTRRDHNYVRLTDFFKEKNESLIKIGIYPKYSWAVVNYLQRYNKIETHLNQADQFKYIISKKKDLPFKDYSKTFSAGNWNVFIKSLHQ